MKKISIMLLLVFLLIIGGCLQPPQQTPIGPEDETDEPEVIEPVLPVADFDNIILFIGDGVGMNHYNVAGTILLNYDSFGWISTDSLSGTTDSAAAATALGYGIKVTNGTIGADTLNITEIAIANGFTVGITTTDTIYGATPAGFSALAENRNNSQEIIDAQIQSNISYFISRPGSIEVNDKRFMQMKDLTLQEGVSLSLDLLEESPNYFLVAEGAKIDTYSHSNDLDGVIREMHDFYEAINYALNRVGDNTLIIVMSDHETGGLQLDGTFTTGGHTNQQIPMYIYGWQTTLENMHHIDVFTMIKRLIESEGYLPIN